MLACNPFVVDELPATKVCAQCEVEKPSSEFSVVKHSRTKKLCLYSYCKLCASAKAKAWRDKNPDKVRVQNRNTNHTPAKKASRARYQKSDKGKRTSKNQSLRKKYGMTLQDYDRLVEEQAGKCAICSLETTLVVDHDHANGAVRALLCGSCNTGLGAFRDNPEAMRRAADYVVVYTV
jgi:hypothetical protein